GHFTLDNASNNLSMMMHLAVALREIGVEFDEKQNYIRCFAHVINLCAQAAIKAMEKDDADEAYSDSGTEPATETSDSDTPQVAMRAICATKKAGSTESWWTSAEEENVVLAAQPHTVQTAMSTENTPILAGAIPAFELFMTSWKAMLDDVDLQVENIRNFIHPGLAIAKKYYNRMGETDAYIIAMFINPSIRFEWIKKNWSAVEQEDAKNIILDKVHLLFGHGRSTTPVHGGIGRIAMRYRNVSQSLDFSTGNYDSASNESIENEVNHYINSSIPPRKTTDMVGYWMVLIMAKKYGQGFSVSSLTTLPIQATSVPSERVFSSSAETDTKRRNRISPVLMEALQMLKFNYKKSRLNFMSDWQSVPDDDEDWLRKLVSSEGGSRELIRREISDSCEFAEILHILSRCTDFMCTC
ncbi:ribonuclease H-like domain-containing protein, partial [Mycena sanguinolenta]